MVALPSVSASGHTVSGAAPNAMFTRSRISSIVTRPFPSQSPAHGPSVGVGALAVGEASAGVGVGVGVAATGGVTGVVGTSMGTCQILLPDKSVNQIMASGPVVIPTG